MRKPMFSILFLFVVACGSQTTVRNTYVSLDHPTDSWEVGNGAVWGTDIDESTTVVKSASRSIHFKNTTPAAVPWLVTRDFIPVLPSRSYIAGCEVQADSTSAANDVSMYIDWYQDDKTASAVTATTTVRDVEAGAVSTWETTRLTATSPSDAAYAKIRIAKDNFAFNAYFDSVLFLPASPLWEAYRPTTQTLTSSVWTTIAFDTTVELVDTTFNTSTGVATIVADGVYQIGGSVGISAASSGDLIEIATYINGAATRRRFFYLTQTLGQVSISITDNLVAGDTVELKTRHTPGAGTVNISGGSLDLNFFGFRLE